MSIFHILPQKLSEKGINCPFLTPMEKRKQQDNKNQVYLFVALFVNKLPTNKFEQDFRFWK